MRAKAGVRIAIRQDGDFVHFYIANDGTLDDAHLCGSWRKVLLDLDPALFEALKLSVRVALQAFLEANGVKVEGFVELPAPGHERVQ